MAVDEISAMMRNFVRQGRTPEEAADMVLDRIGTKRMKEMIKPLLVSRARHVGREVARHLEEIRPTLGTAMTRPDLMAQFLSSTITLSDGRRVQLGDATAADLRDRAEMYRKIAGANLAKADEFDAYAQRVESAGVKNLAALYERDGSMEPVAA